MVRALLDGSAAINQATVRVVGVSGAVVGVVGWVPWAGGCVLCFGAVVECVCWLMWWRVRCDFVAGLVVAGDCVAGVVPQDLWAHVCEVW